MVDAEAVGDGGRLVPPGDHVRKEEEDPSGSLVGGGASASEGDLEGEADGEVFGVEGVLGHEGLAGGEALVGVVGDSEVGVGGLQDVRGVVLVVTVIIVGKSRSS